MFNQLYFSRTSLNRVVLSALTAILILLLPACVFASQAVHGKVIHVDDGDTVILMLPDFTKINVRLSSIDAPESSHTNKETGRVGQPYSANSTQNLKTLVNGKDVDATCFDTDRYGRSVCEIFVGRVSANQEQVRNGFAWANTSNNGRYLRDKSLVAMEAQARSAKAGLWAEKAPIEPWAWRSECWKGGTCPNALRAGM